jgi:hypothetical protein
MGCSASRSAAKVAPGGYENESASGNGGRNQKSNVGGGNKTSARTLLSIGASFSRKDAAVGVICDGAGGGVDGPVNIGANCAASSSTTAVRDSRPLQDLSSLLDATSFNNTGTPKTPRSSKGMSSSHQGDHHADLRSNSNGPMSSPKYIKASTKRSPKMDNASASSNVETGTGISPASEEANEGASLYYRGDGYGDGDDEVGDNEDFESFYARYRSRLKQEETNHGSSSSNYYCSQYNDDDGNEGDDGENGGMPEVDENNAEMFAVTAMSLGMENDDLLFNLMYFGGANAAAEGSLDLGNMFNTAMEETVALYSEHNTPYKLKPASEESVRELNVCVVEQELDEIDRECAVCRDSIEVGQELVKLPHCTHMFHSDCILRWLSLVRI